MEEVRALKARLAQRAPPRPSAHGDCLRCAEVREQHERRERQSANRLNCVRRELTSANGALAAKALEYAAALEMAAKEREKALAKLRDKMDKRERCLHRQLDEIKNAKRALHEELSVARLSIKDFNRDLNIERAKSVKLAKAADEHEAELSDMRNEITELKNTLQEINDELGPPDDDSDPHDDADEGDEEEEESDGDDDGDEGSPAVCALLFAAVRAVLIGPVSRQPALSLQVV